MDPVVLARLQFAITTVYHFFFVPLTLGLSVYIAILETLYVKTGREAYKKAAMFWGKLFLINFAMGVATGILQEFQFGMNWSEYSRFMGDIFGVPLAIEALAAFYLESVFIGVWVFGWDKLSKTKHAIVAWVVAFGSNLSAFWILVANSFMQEPRGYVLRNGRAEMDSFLEILANPHVWLQVPHVIASAVATAGFFVLGISAWHIIKKTRGGSEVFERSFKVAAVYASVGIVLAVLIGHSQAQHMIDTQPMKMAAAEALWETEDPAGLSLFTIGDEENLEDVFAIKIPGALSFLAYNEFEGEVKGIKNLQEEYRETYADRYGADANYIPPVAISYWTFRIMAGAGTLMLFLALYALFLVARNRFRDKTWFLKALVLAIFLPYLANSAGWIFTEIGRQPWVVVGLQRTEDAVSPNVSPASMLFALIAFSVLYAALMVADVYLLRKYAKLGVASEDAEEPNADTAAS